MGRVYKPDVAAFRNWNAISSLLYAPGASNTNVSPVAQRIAHGWSAGKSECLSLLHPESSFGISAVAGDFRSCKRCNIQKPPRRNRWRHDVRTVAHSHQDWTNFKATCD